MERLINFVLSYIASLMIISTIITFIAFIERKSFRDRR